MAAQSNAYSIEQHHISTPFIGEFLCHKENFPQECTRVGKTNSRSIFCERVKIAAPVGGRKSPLNIETIEIF